MNKIKQWFSEEENRTICFIIISGIALKIRGFEDITEWASNHHEKLNGKGHSLLMH